ncbi:MAG TPA: C25 family peptidase propeptide domain-containing protein, partial [Ignavibacteriaceae bacterium]
MKLISVVFFLNLLLCFSPINLFAQNYKVLESSVDHIIIEFNPTKSYSVADTTVEGRAYQKIRGEDYSYRDPGDPWIPEFKVLIGIPLGSNPTIKILEQKQTTLKNKFIIPYPEEDPAFVKQNFEKINPEIYSKNEFYPLTSANLGESYIVRYANVLPILVAPYQFNPVTRDLILNSNIILRVDFNNPSNLNSVSQIDAMTHEFLETSVINPDITRSFTGRIVSGDSPLIQTGYWYNPNKNYFKVYVKEKNVYRLTYEELISSGVQLGSSTPTNKLEMFNDGLPVPIEIFDNNTDFIFNAGDYLKFVGLPPSASPYCTMNIYNLSNVYWFSYQSDSTGVNYQAIPVGTNYTKTYFSNLTTLHLEKDSLYERLGYAGNDNRDVWFWDKASSRNQQPYYVFNQYFESFPGWFLPDSVYVRLKVAMQGMSTSTLCPNDHKAYILINEKKIGDISWDGQSNVVFNKRFYSSLDSIPIYQGNQLKVEVRGDLCTVIDDEIRINWIEFEYWRGNSAFGKYFNFKNYDMSGINRYGIFDWEGSDMRIYIPGKNKMMYLPDPGSYQQFVDTITTSTEYFLAASEYYKQVDSIRADSPSDLRNVSNSSDYIIITHNKFTDIANQLAAFRQNDFPDENIPNPRIKVIDIQQIYDEFSFGLMESKSLKEFVKYAFE